MSGIPGTTANGNLATTNLPLYTHTTVPVVISTTTVLLSLALLTYVLRIYTRVSPYFILGWDDFAITLATAITIANWACNISIQIVTGGRHARYIPPSALQKAGKLGFVSMVLWIWSMTTLKVSVALMLLRIKQTPKWKIGIWSLIAVLFAVGIASTLAQILQCIPIQSNWDLLLHLKPGNCWTEEKQEIVTYSVSALFAATDVTCALLPLAFIRKINRPMREKVALFILMAMGLAACACGLVKTALVKGILRSKDPVWDGANVAIWTYSEEYIGIIAANIPCLKALFDKAFRKLGMGITNISNSSNKNSQHDLDDYSRPKQAITRGKSYPTRMEEDLVGYHTSLRETSRLEKLQPMADSEEDVLLKSAGAGGGGDGFGRDMKMATVVREVSINGRRVDRYAPR